MKTDNQLPHSDIAASLSQTQSSQARLSEADLILFNGMITTQDNSMPEVTAMAIKAGKVLAIGSDVEIQSLVGENTQRINLRGKRVIPGLNDSHTHLIRGGLSYNLELRWEGVPSLAIALDMLKQQAQNTPAPQWVRVVGGWSEFQFAEKRMPTLAEINQAAPDTPVFILHLYGRALLNQAALKAVGFDKSTPNPPGGIIEKDKKGNPTGLLLAQPSALILYSTLAQGPALSYEYQLNSTRHYMREMNRLGITSVIDAGGGGQQYPDDYTVIEQLHKQDLLTVRIAYNLFAQKKNQEFNDYNQWVQDIVPGAGDEFLKLNGAGENLVWSAADFENFLAPRPDLDPVMEAELEQVVRLLVEKRWPFRIHATYDESISRFLAVFERVNQDIPFNGLRFIIDHAETVSEANIERIKALGGGIAVQHRMAFQGEYFAQQYGERAAQQTPPIKQMLASEVPVGMGTDATRVASYNPWVALYWLTSGKTVGGFELYGEQNRLDRETALWLWTKGSAWFSGEEQCKGCLSPGQHADLSVLSADFFTVDEPQIQHITSQLTILAGKVVYGADDFSDLDPGVPPAMPDWSPVNHFSAAESPSPANQASNTQRKHSTSCCDSPCAMHGHAHNIVWETQIPISDKNQQQFWGALGCSCFAF